MISSASIDILIISWIISVTLILILVLTILRSCLLKENNNSEKRYTALLINPNQMIEMKVPVNEQKEKSIDQYSIAIDTETLHPSVDTNQDFYQSILSMNESPYFPVRETIFQIHPRFLSQMIIDLKQRTYSNKNEMKFI
jgi:hypothetical protein